MNDPYVTLGIKRSASAAEIKAAFRSLAQKHHPDKLGGDGERMKEIQAAYDVLKNTDSRAEYDETGAVADKWSRETRGMAIFSKAALFAVRNNGNPLLPMIRKHIIDQCDQMRAHRIDSEAAIGRLRAMKNRIRHNEGDNIIHRVIDDMVQMHRSQITTIEQNIVASDYARELCVEYEETGEMPQLSFAPGEIQWIQT